MSHNDDLAGGNRDESSDRLTGSGHDSAALLVTACRDDLHDADERELVDVTNAALSLIEDTLNRHQATKGFPRTYSGTSTNITPPPPEPETLCWPCHVLHPCDDYKRHLTALHTIAVALLGAKE